MEPYNDNSAPTYENGENNNPIITIDNSEVGGESPAVIEANFVNERMKALLAIAFYFGMFYIGASFINIFIEVLFTSFTKTSINEMSPYYANILDSIRNLLVYITAGIGLFFICKVWLFKDWLATKGNSKKFWAGIGIGFAILLGFSIAGGQITNILINLTIQSDPNEIIQSANQNSIEEMLFTNAFTFIAILLSTVLLAPLVEELVFRKCFFKLFRKSGWKAILITAALFGGIHVFTSILNVLSGISSGSPSYSWDDFWIEIFSFISYFASGIAFGFIYIRSNKNVTVTIGVHMLYNAFAMATTIITFVMKQYFGGTF